jgi:hypothetical protein
MTAARYRLIDNTKNKAYQREYAKRKWATDPAWKARVTERNKVWVNAQKAIKAEKQIQTEVQND